MAQVKVITQETFDEVVKENIDDFDMEAEEALNDAVEQFEKQEISLKMIMKSVPEQNGKHLVINLIEQLSDFNKSENPSESEIKNVLEKMQIEFDRDISYRYQASKLTDVGSLVYKTVVSNKDNQSLFITCLKTFSSLLNGQPDLITFQGMEFLVTTLKSCGNIEELQLILKLITLSCTAHEGNRTALVQCDGIEAILQCCEKHKGLLEVSQNPSSVNSSETNTKQSKKRSCDVIRQGCSALRTLTLDDDVRVQFGNAHEHTKQIVTTHRGLERIFVFIKDHESDAGLASEVCLTLGKLLVRNEFCQQVVDLGALDVVNRLLHTHMSRPSLVRQCFVLIKAMSGNDDVKRAVCKSQAIDLMMLALSEHKDSPAVCESVFAAVTTVSLRIPEHCDVIMSKGFAPLVISAMEFHKNHSGVQKQACMAIRNMVVRTRNHKKPFIDFNVEGLIHKARSKHGNYLDAESKAALRDLDLEVDLKTPWRNEKGSIANC